MQEKKTKILIVEDERELIDLLKAKLVKEGYEVVCAYDGEEGLKMVTLHKPDLILLDIVMPKLDGYGVLEKLSDESIKIPVIIISNSGQPVEIEKTKKLGAVDHLIKTEFSPLDVLKKVNKVMRPSSDGDEDAIKDLPKPLEDETVVKLKVKVLLVEDDSFLREIFSKKLATSGYTVYTAIDGEEALKLIKEIKPKLVLLDIILPTIDGYQVLKQIRADQDKIIAQTVIIMLSNLGQDSDIKRAKELGANDYLIKAHYTSGQLINKIKKYI